MTITALQIRRACAVLNWGSSHIVRRAEVSYEAARSVREDESIAAVSSADLLAIRTAMEKAGVDFVGGGAVRTRGA